MSLKLYCVNTAFKASLGDFLGGGDNLINTWITHGNLLYKGLTYYYLRIFSASFNISLMIGVTITKIIC